MPKMSLMMRNQANSCWSMAGKQPSVNQFTLSIISNPFICFALGLSCVGLYDQLLCRLNPQICSVLDSVETMLHYEASLQFIRRRAPDNLVNRTAQVNETAIHKETTTTNTTTTEPIFVPSVQYEIELTANQSLLSYSSEIVPNSSLKWFTDRDKQTVEAMGGVHRSIGRFVASDTIVANICVGDVLMARLASFLGHIPSDTLRNHAPKGSGMPTSDTEGDIEGSYQVLRVDLLFARLFVQQCDPAPQCWRPNTGGYDGDLGRPTPTSQPAVECNSCYEPFWVSYDFTAKLSCYCLL